MNAPVLAMTSYLSLTARDATSQRHVKLPAVPLAATVGEIVGEYVKKAQLPETDSRGTQHVWHAFLEREQRHLRADEIVGEALKSGDEIVLQPDIQAGGVARR